MYIVKQTIRYNGVTYKLGQKADFNEQDIKEIGEFVEEVKGEPKKVIVSTIVEDKKEDVKKDIEKIEIKGTKNKSTKK